MRIELVKVDLKRGKDEREATACNNNPEEWAKVFVFHGAGETFDRSSDEVGQTLNQDRSGE